MAQTPTIDQMQAFLLSIGTNPSISYTPPEYTGNDDGEFTVTYDIEGNTHDIIMGCGDTLADALAAARAHEAKVTAQVSA